MYVDLLDYLSDVEKKLGPESRGFRAMNKAFGDHPNLRAYTDHLGIVRVCSIDVNQFVDTIDITHRSEDEGSLVIWPFLNDGGQRIYADPPNYVVGYRNPKGFGEVPLPDWKDLLKDANLAPEVIRKVEWYLGAHAPVNYDQVEDEDERRDPEDHD